MPFQDVGTSVEVEKQKSEAESRSDPRESMDVTNASINKKMNEARWKSWDQD